MLFENLLKLVRFGDEGQAHTHSDLSHHEHHRRNDSRTRALKLFTLFLILLAIIWAGYWFTHQRYFQSTENAYSNGNLVRVNSVVSGSVVGFYADNTDLVLEGQLLADLDPTEYRIKLNQELATLRAVVLEVKQLKANIPVQEANVKTKQKKLERARYDFENRQRLVASRAIPLEDFIHSQDDYAIARSELRQAIHQLKLSQEAMGSAEVATHPLVEKQIAVVRSAYYNLVHCKVFAPTTGYVALRTVEVGQAVAPFTSLMAIIPKDYIWVDANFKETQLSDMRIGQPATITFDFYGADVKFKGKVLGIASGSGSVFSIIPPQNATGNWIKIVQRLPVRVALDKETLEKHPIRLGLSAEVRVDISDVNLPQLAQVPPAEPVATTHVFDIDFEPINQQINQIIEEFAR